MRTRTAQWFETKVRYEKTMDDGQQKKVTELYVVDALSFTEAEAATTEEMSAYISGDFDIADIKKATYGEIFFSDKETDDRFYKAKLQYITIDEKTEKEKRTNVHYLIQAANFAQALRYIEEAMSNTMIDYVVAAMQETQIMDVFEHNKTLKKDDKPEYEEEH